MRSGVRRAEGGRRFGMRGFASSAVSVMPLLPRPVRVKSVAFAIREIFDC